MASPEIKDTGITLENVVCVYCGQIMGEQGEIRKTVPTTGRVSDSVIIKVALNLPRFCQQSPDGKHANMTPEQARVQGFL